MLLALAGVTIMASGTALAQTPPTSLPGSADPARIKPIELPTAPAINTGINLPQVVPSMPIPKGASAIRFKLDHVKLDGVTAFAPAELSDIYAPYIGKEISLDVAYTVASLITERYRNAGYFLSLAYVPNQSIKGGTVTIRVVEGRIDKVALDNTAVDSWIIQDYIAQLTSYKPVTSKAVESFLLRLNDIPGYTFRAVLSSADKGSEGAMKLTLTPEKQAGRGALVFDNYSSRFLGPHQASVTYSTSFLPGHQTTISGLNSLPFSKLHYANLSHSFVVAPRVSVELHGGMTKAEPGYTLKPFEVKSTSKTIGATVNYQLIRQRQENLGIKLGFDARNSTSDLLSAPLSRDRIRTLKAGVNYDMADRWDGYNYFTFNVTQGLSALGSSKKGQLNLSRSEAKPDFTKAEASISRLQALTDNWSLQVNASGQIASGPLYSSEEFGYGGQSFGRAYDESEIVGDHGIAASAEIRYGGWRDVTDIATLQPYAFIDSGRVWNDDANQAYMQTATSTGMGVRFATEWDQSGNLGVAFPIHRDIASPVYGMGEDGPRILLRISQGF